MDAQYAVTTDPDPDLRAEPTPRAIAVLVALRTGPRTTGALRRAIGDSGNAETLLLLQDMRGLVTEIIDKCTGARDRDVWYLDHDGLGWLQRNGLDATSEARAWEVQP